MENQKAVKNGLYPARLIVEHKPRRPESELLAERAEVDASMDRIREESEKFRLSGVKKPMVLFRKR